MSSLLVVGGGIIGLFTAYYAMLRGHDVTIVERGSRDHDSCSLGNAGMIVPSHFVPLAAPGMVSMGLRMLPDPEGPFAIRPSLDPSFVDWCIRFARACTKEHVARCAPVLRDLNLASRKCYEELAGLPDQDFGLKRDGLLMLCKREETLHHERALCETARRLGLAAEVLDPPEAERLDPNIRMDIAGAVYFPDDCHLSPGRLVAGLTRTLEEGGVKILWNTEVQSVVARGRSIDRVDTSNGALSADETVIAAGAWSEALLRPLGHRMPMRAGKGYSLTLEAPRRLPGKCSILTEARVAVTPMGTALRFAGTMEITGLDLSINRRRARGIVKSAPLYFPELQCEDFAGVPVWSGLRPCSPDGLPYVGRLNGFTNLSVASGHAMMGVSLAPITGKLMGEILSGERPSLPMALLSPNRFAARGAEIDGV